MKMAPLVMLLGWLAFAGWLATHLPGGAEKATDTAAPAASPLPEPAGPSGQTVLMRKADGHFYADVSVDSQDVRMLVDTGASVVALTGDDAEALGLEWSDNELYPVARGAGGDVVGKRVLLDRMRLGDFEADGVEAVIVRDGLDVSLLGQSFLGRMGKVQIEGPRMVLAGA